MANAIHKFRDRDIRRVVKASQMAGLEIGELSVDPNTGLIKIIPSKAAGVEPSSNPWDRPNAANKKRAP